MLNTLSLGALVGWGVAALAAVLVVVLFLYETVRERDLTSGLLLLVAGGAAPFVGWTKWPLLAGMAAFIWIIDARVEPQDVFIAWALTIPMVVWAAALSVTLREVNEDSRQRGSERDERASNLRDRGVLGEGQVTSYRDTGMRLGATCLFSLSVRLDHPDGVEVLCEQEEAMAEIANWLHRRVAVLYDPLDSTNAKFVSYRESPGAPRLQAEHLLATQQALLEELNEIGIPARAVIEQSEPLNIEINEDGLMITMTAKVLPEEGQSFRAHFPAAVGYLRLDNYQPGKEIWVRFDPEDQTRVSIDFERQGGTVSS